MVNWKRVEKSFKTSTVPQQRDNGLHPETWSALSVPKIQLKRGENWRLCPDSSRLAEGDWPHGPGEWETQTQTAHLRVLLNELWNVFSSQCATVLVISFVWGKAPPRRCGAISHSLVFLNKTLLEERWILEEVTNLIFLSLFESENLDSMLIQITKKLTNSLRSIGEI